VTGLTVTTLALSGLAITGVALADDAPATSGQAATSRLDRIKQALSGLVSDKTLTQAQADKVADTLAAQGVGPGGRPGVGPGGGPGGGGHRGGFGRLGGDLTTAAKTLGMTEAELRTALGNGKSLATLAKEKKVSVDTLVDALTTAAKAGLAQAVKDGRMTQVQADEMTKDLKQRITDRVNATRPTGPRDGAAPGGRAGTTPERSATPSTA
jgi:hypothetical protein